MATKDITDLQVCLAIAKFRGNLESAIKGGRKPKYVDEILAEETGQPPKVVDAPLHRASKRGYIDYGMWARGGYLTDSGQELIRTATACPQIDLEQ